MDTIWDKKILPSRRSLTVVGWMKKRMTTQNRQKSNAKKIKIFINFQQTTKYINVKHHTTHLTIKQQA